jgi:hypothetical protein
VVAVAGVNCTVAVRFVTEVVASGAEAVVVSVTVSVLEGAVTVRVAVAVEAGAVVVAAVVMAAVLVPVALAPSPAPTASSTNSRESRRMRPDVTWRLSPPVCGRSGAATIVHGVPASSARARRPIGLAICVDGRRAALGVAV